MNFVVILCDTLRRDHLGCYGGRVGTPHLDALAAESVVFDNAYAGSFPTLPCRAELFTGKIIFPYITWGPLPRNELLLSEVLSGACYSCAMVTDNFPMCRPGHGYDRGFETCVRIQGQWYDRFRPERGEQPWPVDRAKIGEPERVQQYLHNVADRRNEEDYFAPLTIEAATRWLEANGRRRPFLLWVDVFDPHEPWDPPAHYVPEAKGAFPWLLYPHFGKADRYPEAELEAIRALYRGEVRMVDHWVGRLLRRIDELGLREETCVIFLSDHGMFLGEHNLLGKGAKIPGDIRGWPPYAEVARIPLMVRVPGLTPGRTGVLAHPGDLATTILELAGIPRPDAMTAPSLAPALRGDGARGRPVVVTSWALRGARLTRPSVIRDPEWSLVFWRTGAPAELYHRATDPGETRNVFGKYPAEARRLHGAYLRFLQENQVPARNYWPRRWLVSWGRREAWQERVCPEAPCAG